MKDPVEILVLERQIIKFYDETYYTFGSSDNNKTYDKFFISGDNNSRMTSQIGIELFEDEKLKSSCLIGATGGRTVIHENSTIISYGGLILCCSNTVFKLTIPDLNLEWKTISDPATCFGIHYLNKDYVVHGELEITRLDKDGKIVWQKSSSDIWTTAEGIDDFSVYDGYILATDWDYFRYKFDYEGNLLDKYKVEHQKIDTNEIDFTKEKAELQDEKQVRMKWWKFW
ncbi:hypothetical protein [Flectobacillus roseus]|uniref:hypothetical protein n=1 Tax=Flectobacillus roseus TaxID=502259 RepID=UPI0024B648F0|nr:hypothetical protein [Flectobacillus roseus]MDI9868927.1 hypothetical protein [Flectobacillus roseus]